MAGAGYRLYTAGQVLTAAQVNTYLMEQSVMVFATSAARDSALTSIKSEGNVTYQLDNNDLDIYNGASFSTLVAPAHGVLTAYDPTITQSGAVTHTAPGVNSAYIRIGRMIFWHWTISITGSGTGANVVTLSVPVNTAVASDLAPWGVFNIYDTSATVLYTGDAVSVTASTLRGRNSNPTGGGLTYMGTTGFTAALASGDTVAGNVAYECASDG